MNQLAALLAPVALLVPGLSILGGPAERGAAAPVSANLFPAPQGEMGDEALEAGGVPVAAGSFRVPALNQVRIEQRMTIRISPRAAPLPPNMIVDLSRDYAPRLTERRFGRCMPISGIAGVQYGGGNRLLLFLRDHRLVSAELEKACRARDFYSGFYIDRTEDGQLCVDRDMLHSRAGANCSIKRLRQLVDDDD